MAWMFSASNWDKYFDKFNGDISKWDTSKVTNMESMFRYNQSFNCNGKDINTSVQTRKDTNGNDEKYLAWDVSNVTNMSNMFNCLFMATGAFNNDIGNWNTSNVTNMSSMFVKQSVLISE